MRSSFPSRFSPLYSPKVLGLQTLFCSSHRLIMLIVFSHWRFSFLEVFSLWNVLFHYYFFLNFSVVYFAIISGCLCFRVPYSCWYFVVIYTRFVCLYQGALVVCFVYLFVNYSLSTETVMYCIVGPAISSSVPKPSTVGEHVLTSVLCNNGHINIKCRPTTCRYSTPWAVWNPAGRIL